MDPCNYSSGGRNWNVSKPAIDISISNLPITDSVPLTAFAASFNSLDFRREDLRLETLKNWNGIANIKEEMSQAGLYYSENRHVLRCHYCSLELDDSVTEPVREHKQQSPACPFLTGKPVGNIPSGKGELGTIAGAESPAHYAYMSLSSRLASFECWPVRMRQKPQALAAAGFFYTGTGDRTVCYYCGGGLNNWEDNDDPWVEHATWFGKCPFLLIMKGEDFIKKAKSVRSSSGVPGVSEILPTEEVPPNLEESNTCKICCNGVKNMCFLPCGHVVTCQNCALSLMTCPVCRKPRTGLVKLYFS